MLSEGSLGVSLKWIEDGVIENARQLIKQLDKGEYEFLSDWFKKVGEDYAQKQLQRDQLASKDHLTREGLTLYLKIASAFFRRRLGQTSDGEALERACAAIDAVVRA